ncbi:MAG: permease prefix domain 1-containing protein [Armatimonadota bacterium]|nr:permease prefix domain 1-containing protein [Armatimonadota bacterium]
MHSLLEDYLSEVAAHMKLMPAARRNAEINELRTHLETALAAYREQGQGEDDAARVTLRRFGPPDTLGRQIARTWWRGRFLGWRDSAVGMTFLAALLLLLPSFLLRVISPDRIISPGVILIPTVPLPFTAIWGVLVGVYVGGRLPQRSLAVTASVTMAAAVLAATLPVPISLVATLSVLRVQALNFLATGAFPPLSGFLVNVEVMAQSALYGLAFSALLLTPAAFASRVWAKRRPA